MTTTTKAPLREGSDQNQCPSCRALFKSISAFDKHRIGSFSAGTRRCRTATEMAAIGMSKNGNGLWITKGSGFGAERVLEAA